MKKLLYSLIPCIIWSGSIIGLVLKMRYDDIKIIEKRANMRET